MALFDFVGDLFNKDARDRASRAQRDAISIFGDVDPNVEGQTAQDAYQHLDPAGREAQEAALGQLQQQYQMGGMDPQSIAALKGAQASSAQEARSATDAALNRAQSEGRLNSGRALSAQIQSGQNAVNSNALAGTQAASDAATRRNQAIAGAAQVGSNLTGQAQQTAQGQNQAGQFNAQQLQQGQAQTVQNSLNRAQGIAAGDQALANTNLDRAKEARESAGSIGDAMVTGVTKGLTGGLSDERAKQDIRRLREEALPGVPFATWTWRPGFEWGGRTSGVIAQDLQKVAPHLVHQGPDGFLRVDYSFLEG